MTPRILVKYDVSDAVRINAQASQGFRRGGVNDPLNIPLCTDEDEAIFTNLTDENADLAFDRERGGRAGGRAGATGDAHQPATHHRPDDAVPRSSVLPFDAREKRGSTARNSPRTRSAA